MESETTYKAPILEIAWTRYAQIDLKAIQSARGFYRVRQITFWLSTTSTLFALLIAIFFFDRENVLSLVVKYLFIATPIATSLIAVFGTRSYSRDDWLVIRASADEIKTEIYFYRTILQKVAYRNEYLQRRLNEIQRQIYRSLGNEFSFGPSNEPGLTNYLSMADRSDSGYNDLTGEEYFQFRLEDQLTWHRKKITRYKLARAQMFAYIISIGALGSMLATIGGELSIWVAVTSSFTLALIGWQNLTNYDSIIRDYNKVVIELTFIYDHWHNLEPEQRTTREFYRMVRGCEEVLRTQNFKFIQSTQDALQESNLEQEASLVNRVIAESVESDTRIKQAMDDSLISSTLRYDDGEYNERN